MVSLVFFHSLTAQTNTLNTINSTNVLEYHKQFEILKQQSAKSVDIVNQIGNGNVAETIDRSSQYLNILQYGNFNTTFFVNPNNYPTNAEIRIKGSGNYIDITGSNSISDGMKININANDMTIFMRNY